MNLKFAVFLCIVAADNVRADKYFPNYIPSTPPPIEACSPPIPGSSTKPECHDLEKITAKFVKEEGFQNKGRLFFQAFTVFQKEHGGTSKNYTFSIEKLASYFGKADLTRKSVIDGVQVDQLAYLFNNHARKDWACIITYRDNHIVSISYAETKSMIMAGWRDIN